MPDVIQDFNKLSEILEKKNNAFRRKENEGNVLLTILEKIKRKRESFNRPVSFLRIEKIFFFKPSLFFVFFLRKRFDCLALRLLDWNVNRNINKRQRLRPIL